MTEDEIRAELDRLLGGEVLGWERSVDGVENYLDKGVSRPISITTRLIEVLLGDARKQGFSAAHILINVALRHRGTSYSDADRAQIDEAFGGLRRLLDLNIPLDLAS